VPDHAHHLARRDDAYEVTTNQYIYPAAPFSEGENVIAKVDPSDRNVVMIFDKA
jgi:hypothetical protein